MTTHKWHEVYKAALLETDWSKMGERIQVAEATIEDRRREFALNHGGSPEENQAITDAVRSLNVLKTEVASWSSRNERDAS